MVAKKHRCALSSPNLTWLSSFGFLVESLRSKAICSGGQEVRPLLSLCRWPMVAKGAGAASAPHSVRNKASDSSWQRSEARKRGSRSNCVQQKIAQPWALEATLSTATAASAVEPRPQTMHGPFRQGSRPEKSHMSMGHQRTAGFSLCFHLRFHFGYLL